MKNKNSEDIFIYFLKIEIFTKQLVSGASIGNKHVYELINEDFNQNPQNGNKTINNNQAIMNPQNMNFDMAKRPSFRGLDNIGDKYNMNPVIQCLANIKPVTNYLLKPDKYSEMFKN